MTRTKIVAHTIVKNEQNWIWYTLMSVVDYVDEIMVWDTGSTDKTLELVGSIDNPKIKFVLAGNVDSSSFTTIRQKMLDATNSDWLMILDGDEIWPQRAISETVNLIRSTMTNNFEYLVHPYYDLLGDVYHFQEPRGGRYHIDKLSGHITIRFLNLKLIPGVHFGKPHGQQGIFDENENLIQDRLPHKYQYMNKCSYLHATHLRRSTDDHQVMKRDFKYKYELGIKFPNDFDYPLSFYLPLPEKKISPWKSAGFSYWLRACLQTPFKYFKRRLVSTPSGY